MKRSKVKEKISILDAVDYLSSLAEIDITLSRKASVLKENGTLHPQRWLDQNLVKANEELVIEVFIAVHDYLRDLCEKHPEHLEDLQIRKGVRSIVLLLEEAIEKIEKFTELFKEDLNLDNISHLKECQELQEYVFSHVSPHIGDLKERWEDDLGVYEEDLIGVQKKGLRDLEDVKEDRFYDLFYLKKEDKKPFYDYDLIRRLKLLYDFEHVEELDEEKHSFVRIRQLQDKDFQQKASSVLQQVSHLMSSFYKDSMKAKGNSLVSALNKALMALMLASNPRNVQANQSPIAAGSEEEESWTSYLYAKSTSEYFSDFHRYLRESLHSSEYRKIAQTKGEGKDPLFHVCFLLVHKLCASYFLTLSLQKDMVAFIRKMIQVGSEKTKAPHTKEMESSVWKELIWEDHSIRAVFQRHPKGPIRRVIEAFLSGEVAKGWDPLSHKNTPSHLFSILQQNKELCFLRMPAPLKQTTILRAEVVEEFEEFLKGCLLEEKQKKFLLVNLLDRTFWEDHTRSEALEQLERKEEFAKVVSIIGLPKKTDFYFQRDSYITLDDAASFKEQLFQQFEAREQCGFHWPKLKEEESDAFASKSIEMIHTIFFGKKKALTSFERQDFIEIFYFFLSLKAIDLFRPDYMAFTCKDGIDTGAASLAGFFSCYRMLFSAKPWKEEEKDLLLWILYAPALFFRERAIQKDELLRLVNAMLRFQEGASEKRSELLKACKTLYDEAVLGEIEIKR
jgi:hypothetical protein